MWRHYVYQHRKADTGDVFYVGKGTVRKRRKSVDYERANCRHGRSDWWHRVVRKHGVIVEIVASFRSDEYSQQFERALIAEYGRHSLVNLTDGGDGHAGIVYSSETLAKRSESARGPRSEAWKKAIRRSRSGGGNGGVVKKGDKLPDWWRDRIAEAKLGERNPMHGKPSPRRRAVVDSSGVTYPSVTHAAKAAGLRMQTLHNMLTGFRPNRTEMRFV